MMKIYKVSVSRPHARCSLRAFENPEGRRFRHWKTDNEDDFTNVLEQYLKNKEETEVDAAQVKLDDFVELADEEISEKDYEVQEYGEQYLKQLEELMDGEETNEQEEVRKLPAHIKKDIKELIEHLGLSVEPGTYGEQIFIDLCKKYEL